MKKQHRFAEPVRHAIAVNETEWARLQALTRECANQISVVARLEEQPGDNAINICPLLVEELWMVRAHLCSLNDAVHSFNSMLQQVSVMCAETNDE